MIRAFILVRTKPGTSEEVVKARRIKGVKLANSVLGRYDAVLVMESKSLEELRKTIYEVLEKLEHVEHTETLISFSLD
ncbi:MAG: Lrp/AsnC ligand binding domain-containing protein [Candidatus Brockarchaeota archaeon]|nr:Lrp/AsnC ligand binding domain-containing protein [Candidatus Brockarchaeota archaeon]MBO3808725.1 Lrp/AsnC ligand binding domain-containing protein [Candidatus Brockarchaeota archaeon]